MTREQLASELHAICPERFELIEAHPDGTFEVFSGLSTDDGDGINVIIELAEDGLIVADDGWHTSRRFAWWGLPISDQLVQRAAKVIRSHGAIAQGLRPEISVDDFAGIPKAVESMARIILDLSRLQPEETWKSDIESSTAAAD